MSVGENLLKVKAKIASACSQARRDPNSVRLLAVSKLQPEFKIRQAYEAGQTDFGENYVQEALEKKTALPDLHVNWHMIGHLQSNKARTAVEIGFSMIHSVDSLRLAEKINSAALDLGRVQNILLQVNVGGEASKSGSTVEGFEEFLNGAIGLKALRVHGLMTMPPLGEDPSVARGHFARLRELLEKARSSAGDRVMHPLNQLSMGTSHDFNEAILEGATWIRVGTDIFGARDGADGNEK